MTSNNKISDNKLHTQPLVRIEKAGTFPVHYHRQIEFALVLEGQIGVQIEEQNAILTAGDAIFASPYVLHGYNALEEKETPTLFKISLEPSVLGALGDMLFTYRAKNPIIPAYRIKKEFSDLQDKITLFCGGFKEDLTPDIFISNTVELMIFITSILKITELEISKRTSDNTYMTAIQKCCNRFTDNSFCVKALAEELRVSTKYLQSLFMQNLNMSAKKYILLLRIDRAQTLLRETNASITDIAFDAGFSSISAFNHAFTVLHGFSPSAYRKIIKKPEHYRAHKRGEP